MSRQRQTPWIHQYSRSIIMAIAAMGAINTGYLTLTKLLGNEAACPTSGCEQVLSSPYSEVLGLPLALFGLIAYLSMGTAALLPLVVNPEQNKDLRLKLENQTWSFLFFGATAMLVFSGYLMYIMATEFVIPNGITSLCYYCIASAIFALSLFIVTLIGRDWEDVGQLVFSGIIVSVLVLVGALGVYANVGLPATASATITGHIGPAVTTLSGQAEVALAKHLKTVGAKMYSAYWCPHCYDQKQKFGQQAMAYLPYVECAPDGANAQTAVCKQKKVQGFPTWEINGELYSGTQSLEALADLSGYQGPRNFQS